MDSTRAGVGQPNRMVDVSQYIAAKLVGFDADGYDEAWSRADHDSELPWEVAAVSPVTVPESVLAPIARAVELAANKKRPRPIFGKFAAIGLPMMAAGYVTDTPAISLVTGAIGAVAAVLPIG